MFICHHHCFACSPRLRCIYAINYSIAFVRTGTGLMRGLQVTFKRTKLVKPVPNGCGLSWVARTIPLIKGTCDSIKMFLPIKRIVTKLSNVSSNRNVRNFGSPFSNSRHSFSRKNNLCAEKIIILNIMAKVNIVNVVVLDNPSPFLNPFQFEITFEALEDLGEGTGIVFTFCANSVSTEACNTVVQ